MKKQIFTSVYKPSIVESYKPAKTKSGSVIGTFSVKGLAVENMISQNKTRYSKEVWGQPTSFGKGGKFITEDGKLKQATLFGSLDHPLDDRAEFRWEEAAIAWQNIYRNDDGSWDGEANILNTPQGNIVRTVLDYAKEFGGGELVGVSSRALGETEEVHDGEELYEAIIPETFELMSFDFVYNPSFKTAVATLKESVNKKRKPLFESIRNLAKEDTENKEFYIKFADKMENTILSNKKEERGTEDMSKLKESIVFFLGENVSIAETLQAKKTREVQEDIKNIRKNIKDTEVNLKLAQREPEGPERKEQEERFKKELRLLRKQLLAFKQELKDIEYTQTKSESKIEEALLGLSLLAKALGDEGVEELKKIKEEQADLVGDFDALIKFIKDHKEEYPICHKVLIEENKIEETVEPVVERKRRYGLYGYLWHEEYHIFDAVAKSLLGRELTQEDENRLTAYFDSKDKSILSPELLEISDELDEKFSLENPKRAKEREINLEPIPRHIRDSIEGFLDDKYLKREATSTEEVPTTEVITEDAADDLEDLLNEDEVEELTPEELEELAEVEDEDEGVSEEDEEDEEEDEEDEEDESEEITLELLNNKVELLTDLLLEIRDLIDPLEEPEVSDEDLEDLELEDTSEIEDEETEEDEEDEETLTDEELKDIYELSDEELEELSEEELEYLENLVKNSK